MGWGGDQREVKEGGHICAHIADSLHCTAKTNTTIVKQPYHNKGKNGKIICNSEA